MSRNGEITFTLDFGGRKLQPEIVASEPQVEVAEESIPRIARLMALAIRLEGLIRQETIRDYAEAARLGRVTRARMTQIMHLLHLAPDIQEQILFLPLTQRLNERNLRPIASRIDWDEQRRLFQELTQGVDKARNRPLCRQPLSLARALHDRRAYGDTKTTSMD